MLLALRCGPTASFVPPVGGGLRALAVTPQQPRLARPFHRITSTPSANRRFAKLNIAGTLISPVTFLMAIALNLFGGFLKLAWRLVFLSFVIRIITIFPPAGFLVATVLNKGLGIVSTLTGGISTASRFAASAAGAWRNKLARQLGREPTVTAGAASGICSAAWAAEAAVAASKGCLATWRRRCQRARRRRPSCRMSIMTA